MRGLKVVGDTLPFRFLANSAVPSPVTRGRAATEQAQQKNDREIFYASVQSFHFRTHIDCLAVRPRAHGKTNEVAGREGQGCVYAVG